jgi:hypothetical protein
VAGRLEARLRLGPHLLAAHREVFLRDARLPAVRPAAPLVPVVGPLERHAVRVPAPVVGRAPAELQPEAARAAAAGLDGQAQPEEEARPDERAGWLQVAAVQPDAVEVPAEAAGPHAVWEAAEAEAALHAVREAEAAQPGVGPEPAEAGLPDEALRPEAQPGQDAALGPGLAVPSVAAWAARPGRLRPAPARQPMARSARVIRSLPAASPTMRLSQAAGDEVWSCDLGS